MTNAENNLELIKTLFVKGEIYENFNDIDEVDYENTSEDLCHIVFNDGSAITINPGDRTVEID